MRTVIKTLPHVYTSIKSVEIVRALVRHVMSDHPCLHRRFYSILQFNNRSYEKNCNTISAFKDGRKKQMLRMQKPVRFLNPNLFSRIILHLILISDKIICAVFPNTF